MEKNTLEVLPVLRKETKWLNFYELETTKKTKTIQVRNKQNTLLGEIKWFGRWRQYCLYTIPHIDVIFNNECLLDIQDMIWNLMQERKKK